MTRFLVSVVSGLALGFISMQATRPSPTAVPAQQPKAESKPLDLGNFSVSLAVKDLAASRAFYEKLGFKVVAGSPKSYLIMQNATSTIGLFQGLFPRNILTYNPGWDRAAKTLPAFQDIRELQKELIANGLTLTTRAPEDSTGPASFTLDDPDGNPILVDQHISAPAK